MSRKRARKDHFPFRQVVSGAVVSVECRRRVHGGEQRRRRQQFAGHRPPYEQFADDDGSAFDEVC